nr:hypothetical protein [uncultured Desulfovibrio sp.]
MFHQLAVLISCNLAAHERHARRRATCQCRADLCRKLRNLPHHILQVSAKRGLRLKFRPRSLFDAGDFLIPPVGPLPHAGMLIVSQFVAVRVPEGSVREPAGRSAQKGIQVKANIARPFTQQGQDALSDAHVRPRGFPRLMLLLERRAKLLHPINVAGDHSGVKLVFCRPAGKQRVGLYLAGHFFLARIVKVCHDHALRKSEIAGDIETTRHTGGVKVVGSRHFKGGPHARRKLGGFIRRSRRWRGHIPRFRRRRGSSERIPAFRERPGIGARFGLVLNIFGGIKQKAHCASSFSRASVSGPASKTFSLPCTIASPRVIALRP